MTNFHNLEVSNARNLSTDKINPEFQDNGNLPSLFSDVDDVRKDLDPLFIQGFIIQPSSDIRADGNASGPGQCPLQFSRWQSNTMKENCHSSIISDEERDHQTFQEKRASLDWFYQVLYSLTSSRCVRWIRSICEQTFFPVLQWMCNWLSFKNLSESETFSVN